MCFSFKTPKVPEAPPVPSKSAEDAQRRRSNAIADAQQAQGRNATIITSPLGDVGYGQNVRRTTLGAV